MKQAQVQQAFVYIIAVIVIGFIVLMGFKYINFFTQKKCDIELMDFKMKIDRYITKHSALGEYLKEDIKAPCQYKAVCFVDARKIKSKDLTDAKYAVIQQSVNRGVEQNIFLVSEEAEPAGYNAGIALENQDKVFCLERISGNFYLSFRGQGLIDEQPMTRIESGK